MMLLLLWQNGWLQIHTCWWTDAKWVTINVLHIMAKIMVWMREKDKMLIVLPLKLLLTIWVKTFSFSFMKFHSHSPTNECQAFKPHSNISSVLQQTYSCISIPSITSWFPAIVVSFYDKQVLWHVLTAPLLLCCSVHSHWAVCYPYSVYHSLSICWQCLAFPQHLSDIHQALKVPPPKLHKLECYTDCCSCQQDLWVKS